MLAHCCLFRGVFQVTVFSVRKDPKAPVILICDPNGPRGETVVMTLPLTDETARALYSYAKAKRK